MVTKSFLISRGCSLAALTAATVIAGASAAQAGDIYNVNFSNDTAGSTPATSAAVAGTTDINPSAVGTSGGYTVTVASAANGFTGPFAQMQTPNNGGNTQWPLIQFNLPTNLTSGSATVSWDSEMTAFSPQSPTPTEMDLSMRLLTEYGQVIGGVAYNHNASGGYITSAGAYTSPSGVNSTVIATGTNAASDSWTVNGGVDHFVMTINLDQNSADPNSATFSVSRNGKALMTAELNSPYFNTTGGGLSFVQFQSGAGFGGSTSSWTAGVGNVVIATPEPVPLALMGVGALGGLVLLKRRRTA